MDRHEPSWAGTGVSPDDRPASWVASLAHHIATQASSLPALIPGVSAAGAASTAAAPRAPAGASPRELELADVLPPVMPGAERDDPLTTEDGCGLPAAGRSAGSCSQRTQQEAAGAGEAEPPQSSEQAPQPSLSRRTSSSSQPCPTPGRRSLEDPRGQQRLADSDLRLPSALASPATRAQRAGTSPIVGAVWAGASAGASGLYHTALWLGGMVRGAVVHRRPGSDAPSGVSEGDAADEADARGGEPSTRSSRGRTGGASQRADAGDEAASGVEDGGEEQASSSRASAGAPPDAGMQLPPSGNAQLDKWVPPRGWVWARLGAWAGRSHGRGMWWEGGCGVVVVGGQPTSLVAPVAAPAASAAHSGACMPPPQPPTLQVPGLPAGGRTPPQIHVLPQLGAVPGQLRRACRVPAARPAHPGGDAVRQRHQRRGCGQAAGGGERGGGWGGCGEGGG
jgi:hypothetical protein